ncbi:hypothetical protein SAMN06265365_14725 [Tistlia consotensis]|uniref:Nitrile hydratase n=1 Tax=Tistlia consotensis USBA 355 TaxID=560819 RepID=A0A1Y6CTJ7_9PROT|nr:hypothetical protein [Tistlia consotensis]SMF73328.1 nitrile hydratase [Tistlia consotensis USBA 355]SNS30666.1 hypothetical protein SAMN06265365_14725 [Tistlia consotensis]
MDSENRRHAHVEIRPAERPGYYEVMEIAVRELLVGKGLVGPGEIRRQIEAIDRQAPAPGLAPATPPKEGRRQ